MSEINKECHLFLVYHLVCQTLIVLDGTTFSIKVLLCTLHICMIVDIVLTQFKAILNVSLSEIKESSLML